jgi:hypothetical protein
MGEQEILWADTAALRAQELKGSESRPLSKRLWRRKQRRLENQTRRKRCARAIGKSAWLRTSWCHASLHWGRENMSVPHVEACLPLCLCSIDSSSTSKDSYSASVTQRYLAQCYTSGWKGVWSKLLSFEDFKPEARGDSIRLQIEWLDCPRRIASLWRSCS